jgi:hypothetical protein
VGTTLCLTLGQWTHAMDLPAAHVEKVVRMHTIISHNSQEGCLLGRLPGSASGAHTLAHACPGQSNRRRAYAARGVRTADLKDAPKLPWLR